MFRCPYPCSVLATWSPSILLYILISECVSLAQRSATSLDCLFHFASPFVFDQLRVESTGSNAISSGWRKEFALGFQQTKDQRKVF